MGQETINNVCENLNEIADVLYKGAVKSGIAAMGLVLPDLTAIINDIQDEAIKKRLLEDALTPALQAMEESDGTMLADIITYELLEILHII